MKYDSQCRAVLVYNRTKNNIDDVIADWRRRRLTPAQVLAELRDVKCLAATRHRQNDVLHLDRLSQALSTRAVA
jgi:hypothetical protein